MSEGQGQVSRRPSKKRRLARMLQASLAETSRVTTGKASPNFRAEVVSISADGRKATIQREYNTAPDGIAWPIQDRSRPLLPGDVVWAREENGGVVVQGAPRKANEPPLVPRDGSVGFTGLPTIPTTPTLSTHPTSKLYTDAEALQQANAAENAANQYTSNYTYSKGQSDARYADATHAHSQYAASNHSHSQYAATNHTHASFFTTREDVLPGGYWWVISNSSAA